MATRADRNRLKLRLFKIVALKRLVSHDGQGAAHALGALDMIAYSAVQNGDRGFKVMVYFSCFISPP